LTKGVVLDGAVIRGVSTAVSSKIPDTTAYGTTAKRDFQHTTARDVAVIAAFEDHDM
jgi:hypothetical protein